MSQTALEVQPPSRAYETPKLELLGSMNTLFGVPIGASFGPMLIPQNNGYAE
jgi:hypothetical protein